MRLISFQQPIFNHQDCACSYSSLTKGLWTAQLFDKLQCCDPETVLYGCRLACARDSYAVGSVRTQMSIVRTQFIYSRDLVQKIYPTCIVDLCILLTSHCNCFVLSQQRRDSTGRQLQCLLDQELSIRQNMLAPPLNCTHNGAAHLFSREGNGNTHIWAYKTRLENQQCIMFCCSMDIEVFNKHDDHVQ